MASIVVLGAGMMGSAFGVPLVDSGHEVRLVGTPLDDSIVNSLRASHFHPKLKLELPRAIRAFASTELDEAMRGADAIVLGVSSAGISWSAQVLGKYALSRIPLSMISKGLVWGGTRFEILPDAFTQGLPRELASEVFPVAVAGPCIAGEIARRVETCVVFTGRDRKQCEYWARLFTAPYYHVRLSADVVGVETCAALKNAYAMGVGFGAGIHERRGGTQGSVAMHNYEAAVFAQAIVEMQGLVRLVSGDPQSAVWLPGVGDLNVTCNGGRTGRFGKLLGLGLSVEQAIERMEGATLECLEILSVLRAGLSVLDAQGITAAPDFPLLRHMQRVVSGEEAVNMPFQAFFPGEA